MYDCHACHYFVSRGGCQQDIPESKPLINSEISDTFYEQTILVQNLKKTALTIIDGLNSDNENARISFWGTIKSLTDNFEIEEIKLTDFNNSFGIFSLEQLETIKSENFYIYFPFSEYHDWENSDYITISWDPISSNDKGIGHLIILSSPLYSPENQVIVDEQYAKKNPTIVILPNYIEEAKSFSGNTKQARLQSINTLRIKDIRIIDNWRSGLFTSAYDMEAKYLSVNYSTPTPTGVPQTLILGKITKKEARNQTWKSVNLDAIQNWRENELGYQFVIYHNGSGSYNITMTNQVKGSNGDWLTGNLTTTVTIPSKLDNTVVNQTYDRSYMKILGTGGKIHPTQPMHNGRAIHSFSRMDFTCDWFEN